jgi:DNA-directed RNA polymerase specialized sigma24 family protein
MHSKQSTRIEVGKIIPEAIQAAKAYQSEETEGNHSRYERLFADIYKYFYRTVYGRVKRKIKPPGTEGDVEELCQDIFMEVWQKLHQFQ